MCGETGKEQLYRRLDQARRLQTAALDPLTRDRLNDLVGHLQSQLSEVEARDADAQTTRLPDNHPPPEQDLGGGDICSLEQEPSTDDDRPLD